jgi:hypothetical protein
MHREGRLFAQPRIFDALDDGTQFRFVEVTAYDIVVGSIIKA